MVRGMVYIYTGEEEGKITNALGLALRTVGHGYRAIIIQFMKGRKYIGEYKVKDRLAPEYEIHQFGREEFIDFKNPMPLNYKLAATGLEFVKKGPQEEAKTSGTGRDKSCSPFRYREDRRRLAIAGRDPGRDNSRPDR